MAAWLRCRVRWHSESGLCFVVGKASQVMFRGMCVAVISLCVCYVRKLCTAHERIIILRSIVLPGLCLCGIVDLVVLMCSNIVKIRAI